MSVAHSVKLITSFLFCLLPWELAKTCGFISEQCAESSPKLQALNLWRVRKATEYISFENIELGKNDKTSIEQCGGCG